MSLLEMSFYGGMMILAVTVLRTLTVHRLPKRTFVVLWALALARLLIPFTLPSAASIYSLLRRHESQLPVQLPTVIAPAVNPGTVGNVALPTVPNVTAPVETVPTVPAGPTVPVWTLVWLAGAVACGIFFVVVYVKNRREFRTSLPVENDFLQSWLHSHPLRRKIQIRQFDRISAPLTYGLVRPVILLPKETDWTDEGTLGYVLEHELVHIKRWDSLTKLVLVAALCLHWFNPLVWVMFFLANRDLELSCDESVLRTYGENIRGSYAQALIRLEETKSGLTPVYNHFSKSAIEERVVAIMKTRKKSMAAIVAAVVLVVGITAAFATTARVEPTPGTVTPGPSEPAPAVENTRKPDGQGTSDFTFLAGEYHFLSGAGGWQTELTIGNSGTFMGRYLDSEMGSYDPVKYPNGTVYFCLFAGLFGDLEQIDEYTWSMQVEHLDYPKTNYEVMGDGKSSYTMEGDEDHVTYGYHVTTGDPIMMELSFEDGIRYITSVPYGLEKAKEIRVYLPGTPVSSIPEPALNWLNSAPAFWEPELRPETLPFTVLYNVEEELAFFSGDITGGDVLMPIENALYGTDIVWKLQGDSLFLYDGSIEVEFRAGENYLYRRGYVTAVLASPMVIRNGVPHLPHSFYEQYLTDGSLYDNVLFFRDEVRAAVNDPTAEESQRLLAAISLPRSMGIETINIDPDRIFGESTLDDYPETLAAELTGMGIPNANKRAYGEYVALTDARTVAQAGLTEYFRKELPDEDPNAWTVRAYKDWQQQELLRQRLEDLTDEERKFVEEKEIFGEDLIYIQREFYFNFLDYPVEDIREYLEGRYQFSLEWVLGG